MIKIAVAQYEVKLLPNWESYEDKIIRLIEETKNKNARLVALSEYAGLDLTSWCKGNLEDQFEYVQTILPTYQELFSSLAKQYEIYIQPGSIPVKTEDGKAYYNRAFFFAPNGKISYQDKLFLTRFELESKCIRAGNELRLFETEYGKIGINVCYDSEFPLLAKQLADAGAKLILVPSCTEKLTGLTRVIVSCRARAIENQFYVAQSSLIGEVVWNEFIDINTGQSGIYGPADFGFPEDGIIAQSALNTPMIIYADLDMNKLDHVRQHGEVLNFLDSQRDLHPTIQTIKMTS